MRRAQAAVDVRPRPEHTVAALVDVLEDMAQTRGNLRYVRCALSGEPAPGLELGDVVPVALRIAGPLRGARVFLCGGPDQVAALKKQCFLRGANLKDISADPFVVAAAPA